MLVLLGFGFDRFHLTCEIDQSRIPDRGASQRLFNDKRYQQHPEEDTCD